jgi:catechol 2,3-dioxygenase-like lactoylglutathione lyase family enzyme
MSDLHAYKIEILANDAKRSVGFYSRVFGLEFTYCDYESPYYVAQFEKAILVIKQSSFLPRQSGANIFHFSIRSEKFSDFKTLHKTEGGLDFSDINCESVELIDRQILGRSAISLKDPDGNEIVIRECISWQMTGIREALRNLVSFININAKNALNFVLDYFEYKFDCARVKFRNISSFTHFVASREGLYAVNKNEYRLILRGQFFGLSFLNGDFFCFQANGSLHSKIKKGRLLRLVIADESGEKTIKKVEVAFKGLDNGCHQIDFVDDKLFVVDTYNHRVLRLNSAFKIDAEYYPHGHQLPRAAYGGPHVNSIYYHDQHFWLIYHNGSLLKRSELVKLDDNFNVIQKWTLNARQAHNILFDKSGEEIICDSGGCKLVGRNCVHAEIDGMMLRGLSLDDSSLVVGDSYFSTRLHRRYVPGNVYFFDGKFSLQSVLELPAAPTDIRKINGIDLSLSNFKASMSATEDSAQERRIKIL